jgi:hypothetical protein
MFADNQITVAALSPRSTNLLIIAGWRGGALTSSDSKQGKKENNMLWTVALVFLLLWALGLITGYTMGGFVHVLIVIAIVVVLYRIVSGRRIS